MGQKLRLPQLSIATAIVFFHRFYARMSYEHYDRFTVATTCLFLASKVEETPKKLKDVVIETFKTHHQDDKAPEPDSREFFELKEKILVCERILLQALAFDLSVEHAYRPLLAYVKSIKGTRDLAQVAWNFINDSLRTTICLQYAPRHLAAACCQMASRYLATHTKKEIQFPDAPKGGKWYTSFQTTEDIIHDITTQILGMYRERGGANTGGLSEAALSVLMSDKHIAPGDQGSSSAAAPASSLAASPANSATPTQPEVPADTAVKVEPKVKAEPSAAHAAPQEQATAVKAEPGVKQETALANGAAKRGHEGAGLEEGKVDGPPDAKRSRSDDA